MPATLRVDQGGNRSVLGWLSVPSGATTDDTVNHIIVASNYPTSPNVTVPVWATDSSPQLFGTSIATFSTAVSRWLPAPPELVSPDARHYAYVHPDGTIRLADASGQETIVANPNQLAPLAYTSGGIVLTSADVASNGLWLLDPSSQAITPVVDKIGNYDWREVSNGKAWGADSPGVLGYPPAASVVLTTIPATSRPITAYSAPSGDSIARIAADRQGGLLVVVSGSAPALEYIPADFPSRPPASVTVPSGVDVTALGPRHHADGHGIWFIGRSGVFVFTAGAGLQSIAPGVTTDIVPGGDCT